MHLPSWSNSQKLADSSTCVRPIDMRYSWIPFYTLQILTEVEWTSLPCISRRIIHCGLWHQIITHYIKVSTKLACSRMMKKNKIALTWWIMYIVYCLEENSTWHLLATRYSVCWILVLARGSGLFNVPSECILVSRFLNTNSYSEHPSAQVIGTDLSPIQPSW